MTLKNTGARLEGPVSLVIDGLPGTATLVSAAGTTTCGTPAGRPYVKVNVGSDGALLKNETVSVQLEFTNPANLAITYTTRVLAGPGAR